MPKLQTIILAAGKGTRMKSDIPKVLHKVCGKAIIEYVVDVAEAAGSLKTYVVYGHKGELVSNHLKNRCDYVEQTELLGTGDAVRRVEAKLRGFDGDVLVLCGDTPLLNIKDIRRLIREYKKQNAAGAVLTADVKDPSHYGRIVRNEKNAVTAIREEKDASLEEKKICEINVGVYVFASKDLFDGLKKITLNPKKKEYYLTDLIEIFSQQQKKFIAVKTDSAENGLGVNTRQQLAQIEAILRVRNAEYWMDNGVTIQDPQTTYIASDVKIGKDTVIRPFTFIENNVKVGGHCTIGPCARLRSGTRIADHVDIGNFAEVNNSRIGKGCFMKHFSYLGDAELGDYVNIGAGTVTANFDGVKKNPTKIGNYAFIGSDSILVAPVVIGKNAITGAGSVVTHGTKVPDGHAAVGVPARIRPRREK